jgi:hypothetical protein
MKEKMSFSNFEDWNSSKPKHVPVSQHNYIEDLSFGLLQAENP